MLLNTYKRAEISKIMYTVISPDDVMKNVKAEHNKLQCNHSNTNGAEISKSDKESPYPHYYRHLLPTTRK